MATLPAEPPVVQMHGVRPGEIYLNGVPAGPEFSGSDREAWWIVMSPEATRALRPGRNIIALRATELVPLKPWQVTLHTQPNR